MAYAVRELEYCDSNTLREKYEELIYKNLESRITRESLTLKKMYLNIEKNCLYTQFR